MSAEAERAATGKPEALAGEPASGPGWQLYRGDCLAGLKTLADKSVDVTIMDPPYDEHTHSKSVRATNIHKGYGREKQSSRRAAISRSRELGFEALKPEQMSDAARQVARLTKRWILTFCTVEMVSDWKRCLETAGAKYVRTCAWHKLGSTPQFTGDRPAQAFECIVVAHAPGRTRWNAHGKHGYYAHPIVLERGHGEVRLHTTQKPLSLMRELVSDFTNPGELVLDAYAGSATTALAALTLGRRFLGWELDETYHAIACRRLRGEEAKPRKEQPGLFDHVEGNRS